MALGEFTFPSRLAFFVEHLEVVKSYLPNRDFAPISDLWVTAKSQAKGLFQIARTIDRGIRAVFPTVSFGAFLDAWGFAFGTPDKQGGFGRILAQGSGPIEDALTVTATAATTLSDLKELTDVAGLRYRVVNGPYVFGGAGDQDVDIEAIDTGAATNLEVGQVAPILTFTDPDPNIEEEATLALDLDGGFDLEEDPPLRSRVIDRMQNPGLGGNDIQWKRTIESIDSAVFGYVWPQRINGAPGTVDYGALQTGESGLARILTPAQRIAIQAAVADPETGMPVRQLLQSRNVLVISEIYDVTVLYQLDPDAPATKSTSWDPTAISPRPEVDTYAALALTSDEDLDSELPNITSGKGTDGQEYFVSIGGEEHRIETFTSASPRAITLTDAFVDVVPIAGIPIQAGGGVQTAVHAGIIAYLDSVGPEKDAFASPEISPWDDNVRVLFVQKAAIDADDRILDVTVEDIGGGGAVDLAPTPQVSDDEVTLLVHTGRNVAVYQDFS